MSGHFLFKLGKLAADKSLAHPSEDGEESKGLVLSTSASDIESRQAAEAATDGTFRIASVDDSAAEHLLMSMALRQADDGTEVTYYNSGEALLEALDEWDEQLPFPDVVLLDLRMPGLGGYQTLKRMQSDARLVSIPVVIFTSSPRPSEKETAFAKGATAFKTKPHDFEAMRALIRELPGLVHGSAS